MLLSFFGLFFLSLATVSNYSVAFHVLHDAFSASAATALSQQETAADQVSVRVVDCGDGADTDRSALEVRLSHSSVCRLLHQLGLSGQRPLWRAYQQNPEVVKRWLETE
jgi:hypothetical protein